MKKEQLLQRTASLGLGFKTFVVTPLEFTVNHNIPTHLDNAGYIVAGTYHEFRCEVLFDICVSQIYGYCNMFTKQLTISEDCEVKIDLREPERHQVDSVKFRNISMLGDHLYDLDLSDCAITLCEWGASNFGFRVGAKHAKIYLGGSVHEL